MSDLKQNICEPPRGGANLECLLKCEKPLIENVSAVLNICNKYGFKPVGEMAFLSYAEDPIEPTMVVDEEGANHFVNSIKESVTVRCIVNLEGTLSDTKTSMSFLFDMSENVLVVSVPEDVLWGFSSGEADILRLKVFANLCRVIANHVSASIGYMGTEHLHPEDMIIDDDSETSYVNDDFFSEERVQELFDWYVTFYMKRWEH